MHVLCDDHLATVCPLSVQPGSRHWVQYIVDFHQVLQVEQPVHRSRHRQQEGAPSEYPGLRSGSVSAGPYLQYQEMRPGQGQLLEDPFLTQGVTENPPQSPEESP